MARPRGRLRTTSAPPAYSTPHRGSILAAGTTDRQGGFANLRHDGPKHVPAFAPTRSGKGIGMVIPTLLSRSESAVVYDTKGENRDRTAGSRAKAGRLWFNCSPVEVCLPA